jgi:hypothetical protein
MKSKKKNYSRDKEGHFILIKGAIYQEDLAMVNMHASNISGPNFIKETLLDLKT